MISDLRPFISDHAIVDWLHLREHFADQSFTSQQAQALWQCSQPAACRRLQSLASFALITVIQSGGGARVHSVFLCEGTRTPAHASSPR